MGSYQDYVNSRYSAGNYMQQVLGLASNPFNFNYYNGVGNGDLSYGGEGQQWSTGLTNPFNISFSGKYGMVNPNMTEDVFNSMSDQDWAAFKQMDSQGQNDFISKRKTQVGNTPAKQAQNDMIDQLQKFATEMNMPVDQLLQKDEFAKMLSSTTRAQAIQQGRGQGLGSGGYSQGAADAASSKALLGYQMQRQQLGNQALGQISDIRNQQQGFQLTQNALNSQNDLLLMQQNAAQTQKVQSIAESFFGGYGALAGKAIGSSGGSGMGIGGASGGYAPQANYSSQPNYSGGGPTYGTYGGGGVGYNYPSTVPQNTGGNY